MNYQSIMQGQAGSRIIATWTYKNSEDRTLKLSSHYGSEEEVQAREEELKAMLYTDIKRIA